MASLSLSPSRTWESAQAKREPRPIAANRQRGGTMPEGIIGVEEYELEIPEFELSDLASGIAALETLFLHYGVSPDDQLEYFNSTLVGLAGLLVLKKSLISSNPHKIGTLMVQAQIPIASEEYLEFRMNSQQSILDAYRVEPDHADIMKKAVLFYVASELFNKRSFPKPGLPDFMAV